METNVIYNEDCIAAMKRLPKDSVDLVLTDIPYGEVNRESNGLRELDRGNADIVTFDMQEMLSELYRVCKGSFYLFCGMGQISEIHKYFATRGCNTRLIIWEKTNPMPMNGQFTWLSGIEPCVFAKKSGATYNYNCRNTVLRYPIAEPTGHPTPKPINLMRELLMASSNPQDIVLEPFMGGGTTIVACIKEKRRYIGYELERKYYDIAKKRIQLELQQPTLF